MSSRNADGRWMKLGTLAMLVLAALAVCVPAPAADKAPDPSAAFNMPWGPFLQDLTPTGVNVVWCPAGRTDDVLEYGPAADKLDKSVKPAADALGRAAVAGLEPGKTYYYRIRMKDPAGDKTAMHRDVSVHHAPARRDEVLVRRHRRHAHVALQLRPGQADGRAQAATSSSTAATAARASSPAR